MHLNLDLYTILADDLDAKVDARQSDRLRDESAAKVHAQRTALITPRLEGVLERAMGNPLVFDQLARQGAGGFLSGLIVRLSNEYRERRDDARARHRGEELIPLLQALHSGLMDGFDVSDQLKRIGYVPAR